MAIVTSNEYDHIDIVNGSNTNRHMLKDTVARAGIDDLKNATNSIQSHIYNVLSSPSDFSFQFGRVKTDGGIYDGDTNYVGCLHFIEAHKGSTISTDDGTAYKFGVCVYSSDSSSAFVYYKGVNDGNDFVMPIDGYIRFSIRKNPTEELSDLSIANHFILNILQSPVDERINTLETKTNIIETQTTDISKIVSILERSDITYTEPDVITYQFGQVVSNGLFDNSQHNYCGTPNFIRAKKGSTINVDNINQYRYSVAVYTEADNSTFSYFKSASDTSAFVMPYDGYVRYCIRKNPAEELSDTTISAHFNLAIIEETISDRVDALMPTQSPYYRYAFYGLCSLQNYVPLSGSFQVFDENTTATDFFSAFTTLCSTYSDYVTISDEGACSDNITHIYSYELKPLGFSAVHMLNKQPKIILVSGQHGFEKAMPFGLYYFVRELLTNWKSNPVLDYIRNYVHLIILPCMNPYGFDRFEYKNANRVNLNRNYDYNFVPGDDPTSSSYGGTSAFSEPETIIVRNIVNANTDAIAVLDLHTNGSGNVDSYTAMNWYSFPSENITYNDECFKRMYFAAGNTIIGNTAHFIDEFTLSTDGHFCGRITAGQNESSTLKDWARGAKSLLSATVEGFCGFPNADTTFGADVQRANGEIVLNFIRSLLAELCKANS